MGVDVTKFFVPPSLTIEETLPVIQKGGEGIALVVDNEHHLVGTITDGDIRRAILNKISLYSPISELILHRPLNYKTVTVAHIGAPKQQLFRLMKERVLRQIPLLDEQERVVGIALLSEFVQTEDIIPMTAVVMAGGLGQRLLPLTEHLPKPMLPLHNRPLMERTIEQLRSCGIRQVSISTNYKSDIIMEHFGDGKKFGVDIQYINEKKPLGTAGALGMMNERSTQPILVINGDVVTQLDFRAMLEFHQSHEAAMTVAVRGYDVPIPFGVVETDDVLIQSIIEKPTHTVLVNAGVYLINPVVFRYIPQNTTLQMTELISSLISEKHRVVSFPIQEYWMDVGHHADYVKANEDAKQGKI